MTELDKLFKPNGPLASSAALSLSEKIQTDVYYQHKEKAECALTVGTSWYGGDYFEFGSHDLTTFRNMLTAYDVCSLTRRFEDVRFYAFDVFGDDTGVDDEFRAAYPQYLAQGNQIALHRQYIEEHSLYKDKCHLVQGLFKNTLTNEFKAKYQAEGRNIGFAFIDCNMASSYATVFDFIFDLMLTESHIYMDEYFQSAAVINLYQKFTDRLRKERNMGSVYIRNAGGFGGLFRLYSMDA